jgi:hypothetical protein
MNQIHEDNKNNKKLIAMVINKSDSIVAISGLFANVGVFGVTIRNMKNQGVTYMGQSAAGQMTTAGISMVDYAGTGFYIALLVFALIIAYGLWNFRSWGWLITVIFSVVCIFLVIPDILNYHAALVSMILLSYITHPAVRNKYLES